MLFFFLTECSLAPCQGGLEKAKAGTNWNLQVSNSHFSFSTWSFALRGFCSWVVVSVDISSHFYFLKKWKWIALYLMGADQQRHESRTCLGSLWWERQDNHEQNIPRESFLFNTFQFPGPTASAWTASIWVNEKILVHSYHQLVDGSCAQQLPTHMMPEAVCMLFPEVPGMFLYI